MADDAAKKAEEAKKALEDIKGITGALEEGFRSLGSRLSDIGDEIKDSTSEARSFDLVYKDINRSVKSLSKTTEDQIKNQIKLNEKSIGSKDIQEQINKKVATQIVLGSRIEQLQKQLNNDISLEATERIEKEKAINELQKSFNELAFEAIEPLKKQKEQAEGIEAAMKQTDKDLGIFAGVLKGIGKIPILGDLVDTKDALKAAREETEKTGSGLKGLKAGLGNLKGQVASSLTNPANIALFVITQIGEALKGADKGAGDLAKGFNMTYNEAMGVREELTQIGNLSGDVALNTRALQETLMAVGQALGSNAMLNEKDLKTFTKLREQAGFTNEELLGIEKTTLATGGNLEENAKNILFSAKLTGLNNKVLLNEKDIMRDVAKASDAIKLSLGGSGKKLGEAAAQAKALGMSLEQVDKIAGSLLDFESSIVNELSAELITGKQINLEQARLYALNNDMAGLSREIAKNFGSVAEFGKMNRIAQEAAAKAVGMQREELATTLTDQAALKGLSGDKLKDAQAALDLARAQGMTEDQIAKTGMDNLMKQQSVQDRLNQSVEKLKEIFVSIAEPIMQIISPFVDILLPVLSTISGVLGSIVSIFKGGTDELTTQQKIIASALVAFTTIKAITLATMLLQKRSLALRVQDLIISAQIKISEITTAVAKMTGSGATSFGITAAIGLAAGAAAYGYLSSMKDGVIDPRKGPVLSGGFGSVQLDPKDKAMYGADGTIKVGTNLGGGKSNSTPQQQDNSALIAEIRAMRQEQAKSNSKPTVIENSVNGTRFGTAVAMNTYKIS